MITENDKRFIEMVVEGDTKVEKAQWYIKENYGLDTTYDSENMELTIESGNNALKAVAAKDYFESQVQPEFVSVILS